jgi:acetyl esterase/lipase
MRTFFYHLSVALSILLLVFGTQQAQAQAGRYQNPVFNTVTVTSNVKYGKATTYLGFNKDLKMDIYQPYGDASTKRPVVVMIFGGAFLVGRKEATDMVAWCRELAKHGYVCVSIDYRLGFTIGSQRSATRAVYRAVQDARAALRFLVANKKKYKIDASRIFLGGESAGAITALHTAFLDTDAKRPDETRATWSWLPESSDMGCLDCSGNTLSNTFSVKGIINIWGAINNVNHIEGYHNIPVVSIHGEDDGIVPINVGSPFDLAYLMPTVYGSRPISERLTSLNKYNEFYPYPGQGHVFYGIPDVTFPNSYWPPVFQQGKNFLYTRLVQLGNTSKAEEPIAAIAPPSAPMVLAQPAVYTSDNRFSFTWQADVTGDVLVGIYNFQGQCLSTEKTIQVQGNNTLELYMPELSSGMYIASFQTPTGIVSSKFFKK